MSSFNCGYCGTPILDSPTGYTTGCKHYPLKENKEIELTRAEVLEIAITPIDKRED